VIPSIKADGLTELLDLLTHPRALGELAVLAACLMLSWCIVWLARGRETAVDSIWFGKHAFDGVLFPLIAVALAFAGKLVFTATGQAAVLKLAVPILLSLLVIRLSARVLSATLPSTRWVRILERSISWAAWIAVVLWITGVLPVMLDAMDDVHWQVGKTRMSLRTLFEGTLTAGLVMMLALWVSAGIEKKLLHGTGSSLSLRKIAANLIRVVLLFVGLLVAMSAVGIDLTALSVLGGAVGVGVGLGLQKIVANYISGFVILAERSLRIGDMVKIDNFEGRVRDIRTRYTVIQALNGRESIVPNEMLITQRVENSSLVDPRVLVVSPVQVAYGTDVRALQPKLEAAVRQVARVLADPGPAVQLDAFAADGMNLNVAYWVRDPENGLGSVRSDVNLAVLDLLTAEGIEIPFPQRVTHVRVVGAPTATDAASSLPAD
jgi:small-conductance mechanosensitive channel